LWGNREDKKATAGFLPVVPVMTGTFFVYLGVHAILLVREGVLRIAIPTWIRDPYFYVFFAIFLLALAACRSWRSYTAFPPDRDFLTGAPHRGIYEPERVAGSVFSSLGCYRAKVLSHTGVLHPLLFDIPIT